MPTIMRTRRHLIEDRPGGPGKELQRKHANIFQSLGDARALEDAGRRLIRFQLNGEVASELRQLIEGLEKL